jgi:hypothetical protein
MLDGLNAEMKMFYDPGLAQIGIAAKNGHKLDMGSTNVSSTVLAG